MKLSITARSVLGRFLMLLAVGGACLWVSTRNLNWRDVWSSLLQAQVWWLLAAVLSVILVAVAKAMRWWYLYPPGQRPASLGRAFDVLMTAQMLNILVPVRLGELARMGLMFQEGLPVPTTLSTVVIEKSIDLLTVGTLVGLAVPSALLPNWFPSSAGLLSGAGGALLLVVLVVVWVERRRVSNVAWQIIGFRDWLPGRLQKRLAAGLAAMLDGLGALASLRAASQVIALTALSWAASVFTMAAMLAAFGLPARWYIALTLSLALYLSNVVPTPPALVGVVGAVTVVTLGWFGVPEAGSAVVGLALNVVLVGPVTLIGGWFTWYRFSHLTDGTLRERWGESLGLEGDGRVL